MVNKTSQELVRMMTLRFWEQGYAQTSVADLLAETKLSQSQFTRLFHGKHAAFLRCLTDYNQLITDALQKVQAESVAAGEPIIEQLAALLLAPVQNSHLPDGCLFVNTIAEFGNRDTLVTAQTQLIEGTIRNQFVKVLSTTKGVQSAGDLATTLLFLRNGYQIAIKQGTSYRQLKSQATSSIRQLLD